MYYYYYFFTLSRFSYLRFHLVFYWRFSNGKSLQVSTFLLNILADLIKDIVCIVSILPLISNSSTHLSEFLGTVPSAPITIGLPLTSLTAFSVFKQGPRTCFSFTFFQFSLCSLLGRQSPLYDKFSFFFFFLIITNSGLLAQIT